MLSFINELADFFLPKICLHCNKEKCESDDLLCKNCFAELKIINNEYKAEKLKSINHESQIIQDLFGLYFFIKDSPIQTLLHELKYQNKFRIGKILGGRLAFQYYQKLIEKNIDVIVPIPLHKVKEAERGYNQSYFIAKGLSKVLKCKIDTHLVKRKKFTVSQTNLNRIERTENMQEAFAASANIKYQNILLVDDVITTGATIIACASEIKKIKDANIFAASIALV